MPLNKLNDQNAVVSPFSKIGASGPLFSKQGNFNNSLKDTDSDYTERYARFYRFGDVMAKTSYQNDLMLSHDDGKSWKAIEMNTPRLNTKGTLVDTKNDILQMIEITKNVVLAIHRYFDEESTDVKNSYCYLSISYDNCLTWEVFQEGRRLSVNRENSEDHRYRLHAESDSHIYLGHVEDSLLIINKNDPKNDVHLAYGMFTDFNQITGNATKIYLKKDDELYLLDISDNNGVSSKVGDLPRFTTEVLVAEKDGVSCIYASRSYGDRIKLNIATPDKKQDQVYISKDGGVTFTDVYTQVNSLNAPGYLTYDKINDVVLFLYATLNTKDLTPNANVTDRAEMIVFKGSTGEIVFTDNFRPMNDNFDNEPFEDYEVIPRLTTEVVKAVGTTSLLRYKIAIEAPNGKIYCVPNYDTEVLIIDIDTYITKKIPTGLFRQGTMYGTAHLTKEGLIICIPFYQDKILVINTNDDTISFIEFDTTLHTDGFYFRTSTTYVNNKIYCLPLSQAPILVIDTINLTAYDLGDVLTTRYNHTVADKYGKVYCFGDDYADYIKIDSADDSIVTQAYITDVGSSFSNEDHYVGNDGRIYLMPVGSTGKYLIIDPEIEVDNILLFDTGVSANVVGFHETTDGTRYFTTSTGLVMIVDKDNIVTTTDLPTGVGSISMSILAPNGKIYLVSESTPGIVQVFNTVTNLKETHIIDSTPPSNSGYKYASLANDGNIYRFPHDDDDHRIMKIDTETDTISYISYPNDGLLLNDAYETVIIAKNDKLFGIPYTSDDILVLNTGVNDIHPKDNRTDPIYSYSGYDTLATKYALTMEAPNGKIYFIPYSATTIRVMDPRTNEVKDFDTYAGATKWRFAVITPDGRIFCIPYSATQVLVIDTNNDTSRLIGDILPTTAAKFMTAELCPNGKIFCAPYNATSYFIIDTITEHTLLDLHVMAGTERYYDCEISDDGNVYCFPTDANNILKYDYKMNTISNIVPPETGGDMSYCSIRARNGKIYTIPYLALGVTVLDPKDDSVKLIPIPIAGTNKFFYGTLANNDKIYCLPFSATWILVIDTLTDTTYAIEGVTAGALKYRGGVLGNDDKIYGTRYDAVNELVVDTRTDTFKEFPTSVTNAYFHAVKSSIDGNIYAAPYSHTQILKIEVNPKVRAVQSYIGYSADVSTSKYMNAVMTPDDIMYCIPFNAAVIMRIDTKTNVVSTLVGDTLPAGGEKWWMGVYAPNGKIYCPPDDKDECLVIDTKTDTYKLIGSYTGSDLCKDAILAPNGKIYCLPQRTANIMVIDTNTDTMDVLPEVVAGDYRYWKGILLDNGKIVCAPYSATQIMVIDTNDDSVSYYGNYAGAYKFKNINLADDGYLYCMPWYGTASILKIDPRTFDGELLLPAVAGSYAMEAAIKAPNGMIYGIPSSYDRIVRFNPEDQSVKLFGTIAPDGAYHGAILGDDEKIYCLPYSRNYILVIDTKTDFHYEIPVLFITGSEYPVKNSKGKIFAAPYNYDFVLGVEPRANIFKTYKTENFGNIAGAYKFRKGFVGPNGKIYCIPDNSYMAAKIDSRKNAIKTIGSYSDATVGKFHNGVVGDNGKIYGIPYDELTMLKIDTTTDEVEAFGTTIGITAFEAGVKALNGNIYCIPRKSPNIIKINTVTDTLELVAYGSATVSKHHNGILAPNGKIYCAPSDTTVILVIDTNGDELTYSEIAGFSSGVEQFFAAGALADNGKIYFFPRDQQYVLVVDTNDDTAYQILDTGFTGVNKFSTAIKAPDGKIYAISDTAIWNAMVDPETDIVQLLGNDPSTAPKSNHAVMDPSGVIWGIPHYSQNMLRIDTKDSSVTRESWAAGTYKFLGGVVDMDGNVICVPYSSVTVGKITTHCNLRTPKIGSLSTDYDEMRYIKAIEAFDGKIYCISDNGKSILVIDSKTNDISYINFEVSHYDGPELFSDMVMSNNGDIILVPARASYVMKINTMTGIVSKLLTDVSGYNYDYKSGILAPDNKVYCAPFETDSILIIDPRAVGLETSSEDSLMPGVNPGYNTSHVLKANDGMLYFIPYNKTQIVAHNVLTSTTYIAYEEELIGENKFEFGVKAPNGNVYCIPYDFEEIVMFNPNTHGLPLVRFGELTGSGKYKTAIAHHNGKVYCIPFNANEILIIDSTREKSYKLVGNLPGTEKYKTATLGLDGRIYCYPYNAEKVLIIDPESDTYELVHDYSGDKKFSYSLTGRYGKIFGIPESIIDIGYIEFVEEPLERVVGNERVYPLGPISVLPGKTEADTLYHLSNMSEDGIHNTFVKKLDDKLLVNHNRTLDVVTLPSNFNLMSEPKSISVARSFAGITPGCNPIGVVYEGGGFSLSYDGGKLWTHFNKDDADLGFPEHATSIDVHDKVVVVGTDNPEYGIVTSMDCGKTWNYLNLYGSKISTRENYGRNNVRGVSLIFDANVNDYIIGITTCSGVYINQSLTDISLNYAFEDIKYADKCLLTYHKNKLRIYCSTFDWQSESGNFPSKLSHGKLYYCELSTYDIQKGLGRVVELYNNTTPLPGDKYKNNLRRVVNIDESDDTIVFSITSGYAIVFNKLSGTITNEISQMVDDFGNEDTTLIDKRNSLFQTSVTIGGLFLPLRSNTELLTSIGLDKADYGITNVNGDGETSQIVHNGKFSTINPPTLSPVGEIVPGIKSSPTYNIDRSNNAITIAGMVAPKIIDRDYEQDVIYTLISDNDVVNTTCELRFRTYHDIDGSFGLYPNLLFRDSKVDMIMDDIPKRFPYPDFGDGIPRFFTIVGKPHGDSGCKFEFFVDGNLLAFKIFEYISIFEFYPYDHKGYNFLSSAHGDKRKDGYRGAVSDLMLVSDGISHNGVRSLYKTFRNRWYNPNKDEAIKSIVKGDGVHYVAMGNLGLFEAKDPGDFTTYRSLKLFGFDNYEVRRLVYRDSVLYALTEYGLVKYFPYSKTREIVNSSFTITTISESAPVQGQISMLKKDFLNDLSLSTSIGAGINRSLEGEDIKIARDGSMVVIATITDLYLSFDKGVTFIQYMNVMQECTEIVNVFIKDSMIFVNDRNGFIYYFDSIHIKPNSAPKQTSFSFDNIVKIDDDIIAYDDDSSAVYLLTTYDLLTDNIGNKYDILPFEKIAEIKSFGNGFRVISQKGSEMRGTTYLNRFSTVIEEFKVDFSYGVNEEQVLTSNCYTVFGSVVIFGTMLTDNSHKGYIYITLDKGARWSRIETHGVVKSIEYRNGNLIMICNNELIMKIDYAKLKDDLIVSNGINKTNKYFNYSGIFNMVDSNGIHNYETTENVTREIEMEAVPLFALDKSSSLKTKYYDYSQVVWDSISVRLPDFHNKGILRDFTREEVFNIIGTIIAGNEFAVIADTLTNRIDITPYVASYVNDDLTEIPKTLSKIVLPDGQEIDYGNNVSGIPYLAKLDGKTINALTSIVHDIKKKL